MPDETDVRPARREDLELVTAIESEADQTFVPLFGPLDWRPTKGQWRMAAPGFLLVAGEPVAGFAHVMELEGIAHLEQLAVRPALHRQGIGTALVRAAMDEAARRGYAEISLCTYADVRPWASSSSPISVRCTPGCRRRRSRWASTGTAGEWS
jgi:ribosomal protein S18 acetylase RimI-like enzyme